MHSGVDVSFVARKRWELRASTLPTCSVSGQAHLPSASFGNEWRRNHAVSFAYEVFFAFAARALITFFRLLLIITMLKNDPTTADPSSVRITGILIAQTRGGNRS